MQKPTNRLKRWLTTIGRVLDRPLSLHANYFLSLIFFLIALDTVSVLLGSSALEFFLTGTLIAYVLTLGYSYLECTWLRRLYNALVYTVVFIFFLIDFVSLYIYGQSFNKDYAAAIVNTNEAEMREFASTYLSVPMVLLGLALFAVLGFLAYKWNTRPLQLNKWVKRFFYLYLPVCVFIFATCPPDKRSLIGKIYLITNPTPTPNLADYYTHPSLAFDAAKLPDHVVLIVGESLSKTHCSLYGYQRPTMPRLEALRDSGELFVFEHAVAPATSTEPALKDVFTTYPELDHHEEWYRCTTLFEVIRLAGFRSYWVSNQSKKGLWDNTVGKFSDLSDENYFVGNKFAGTHRTTTDDELLPLLRPLLNKGNGKKQFYTVHLLGSHPAFDCRYPAHFDVFHPEDYTEYAEHQRKKMAAYDNSVLFNDSVVNEVIQLYQDKDALVVYFSDHALDLYQSSDSHCGHAKADAASQEYGKQIPFVIYLSPLYQQRHPEMTKRIASLVQAPINTGKFLYLLMDLLGISFQEKQVPDDFSPFGK